MAPVPSEDTSSRHSETDRCVETSHATASPTTPPSRSSSSNEDNPFIQFRRFADSQISSFLQSIIGLPSLFERPSPTARWIVIQKDGDGHEVYVNGDTVTMAQRRELEEGWRKQREQEAEEQARGAETARTDEMRKWGGNVDAVAAGHIPVTTATSPEKENGASKKNGGLLDWLGWDGSHKQESKQEASSWNGPLNMPSIRMTVQEEDKSELLNPFSGKISEAVSWLLTNEYSPVYLRGHIPQDVHHDGPSFYHALHHAHWPDFRAASSPDRFEDELRFRVPWCDAFEDLVSLQNNGHMIDRDESTRTSSAQWLNDMIRRGSLGEVTGRGLGPQWSTEYARAVLPFACSRQAHRLPPNLAPPVDPMHENLNCEDAFSTDPVLSAFEIIQEMADLDDNGGRDIFGHPKHWTQELSDSLIQAVAKDLMKPGVLDELRRLGFASHTQVIEHLFGDGAGKDPSQGFLMAPPDILAATTRAALASETEASHAGSISDEQDFRAIMEEEEKVSIGPEDQRNALVLKTKEDSASVDDSSNMQKVDQASSCASSSSSASWSRWNTPEEGKDSVVSTMTTTERRTLSDGTIETKRVLKKRFADGREERNESVERQRSFPSDTRPSDSKSAKTEGSSTTTQDKQTQTDVKRNAQSKKSGWFWRE